MGDLAATREAGMGLPNAVPSVRLLGVPVPLKYVSLCVLVVQMSMMVLALRGSRQSSDPYITSTAVFLSEIIKLSLASAWYLMRRDRQSSSRQSSGNKSWEQAGKA